MHTLQFFDVDSTNVKLQLSLENQNSTAEKARLIAVASEHSSDWLNAIPVVSLGLKLDNTSLRIAVSLRLGAPLCQRHTCVCGERVNVDGRHGLSCRKAAGRHPRHSHCNDLIKRALASAGVPAVREPPGLSRSDGKRPDGLTLFPWKEGRSLVWDFTCVDTLAPSYISQTSKEAGKAANQAEKRKTELYHELQTSHHVIPVAMETMGSWGREGLKFIKDLGSRIAEESGEKRSTSFLFQSIGIANVRGNAMSVLGTVPNSRKLDEIYYL